MRVLVATSELQGQTPGDYAHTVTGELVTATVTQCDCPDCGCDRGFAGLASHRATTTAMVVEHPHVTTSDLRDVIFDYLVAGGWLGSDSALLVVNGSRDEVEVVLPPLPGVADSPGYRLLWDSAWERPREPEPAVAPGPVTVPATSLRVYAAN